MSWSWVGVVAVAVYVVGAVFAAIIAWIEEDGGPASLAGLTWPMRVILRAIRGRW